MDGEGVEALQDLVGGGGRWWRIYRYTQDNMQTIYRVYTDFTDRHIQTKQTDWRQDWIEL